MDFSKIIITLDYFIRKIMALLDDLMKKFGSATPETPETPDVVE